MLQFILEKGLEYAPEVAMYLFLAILVVCVVYWITTFYHETNGLHTTAGDMSDSLARLETTLLKIHTGFNTLNNVLLEKSIISQSCYAESNSPRVLNSLGRQLYTESPAERVLQEIAPELLTQLESKSFDSFLEVESESLNLMLQTGEDSRLTPLKDFVYNNPTFHDTQLTYSDVLFIMALKLRDIYKEKHPELQLADGA